VGFAGSTADALTLLERLEKKLEEHPGQLTRYIYMYRHKDKDIYIHMYSYMYVYITFKEKIRRISWAVNKVYIHICMFINRDEIMD
jgi:ATP-dependent protease HslVU (ClpYQ) peptidase subunit